MTRLTIEAFEAWLDAYGRASAEDDPDASAALFSADARYHESPFDPPIVGRQAIRRYWEGGARRLADKRSTHEILAVGDDVGIARWRASFTVVRTGERVALDCLFVARFGEDGTCVEFREWWHRGSEPLATGPVGGP
ncbi:MAG TPA: nuclear transport factor 2 family protein [Candidatus Limnocylindrales bacterium]|nr:nuclear transport factor 2 family protein [Candidatus Limnocylindrales bacterium]